MLKKYYVDAGLLVLRLGIGAMFIMHGFPKISGGVEKWTQLGSSMSNMGIDFAPAFWGFMAAIAEFGGGILLVVGLGFRVACFLLLSTMVVAVCYHLGKGDGVMGASHAIESAILFFSLFLIGPGKYRIRF